MVHKRVYDAVCALLSMKADRPTIPLLKVLSSSSCGGGDGGGRGRTSLSRGCKRGQTYEETPDDDFNCGPKNATHLVDYIYDDRDDKLGGTEYLVCWEGQGIEEDRWQPDWSFETSLAQDAYKVRDPLLKSRRQSSS